MRNRQYIVDKISSWLGCHEGDAVHKHIIDTYNSHLPLARGYKVKYTDSWCATTISAAAIECGYTDIIPTECSCQKMIDLFKAKGIWVENDAYVPKPADIIFYDWQDTGIGDNVGWSDHVGMVEKCDGNIIVVIEGNKNDGVNRRSIQVNGKFIRGYGVPKYDEQESPIVIPNPNYQYGIDVNQAQGVIDWNRVKAAGISFACIRSTKKSGNADIYFERNLAECIDKRIDYSCFKYAYSRTHDESRIAADGVINLLGDRKMPIWWDLEDDSLVPLGKDGIEGITLAFIGECKEAGFDVGIYCNKVWYDNYISSYLKNRFSFWIARYGKNTGQLDEAYKPKEKNVIAWQYTSKGVVDGIEGFVDRDVLF